MRVGNMMIDEQVSSEKLWIGSFDKTIVRRR